MDRRIRVHALEHAEGEGAGKIADWARATHEFRATRVDLLERLPDLREFDLLVVMGGGMNVYQYRDYPWLKPERELVAAAIAAGKAVLGICLGAQMIADALGARVYQNAEKEVGWYPVRWFTQAGPFHAFPPACEVFHWHGDTFELPAGATLAAESGVCPHQAFSYGERVIGLQFHVEVTREAVAEFVRGGLEYLVPAPWIQAPSEIVEKQVDLAPSDTGLRGLLDYLAARVSA